MERSPISKQGACPNDPFFVYCFDDRSPLSSRANALVSNVAPRLSLDLKVSTRDTQTKLGRRQGIACKTQFHQMINGLNDVEVFLAGNQEVIPRRARAP